MVFGARVEVESPSSNGNSGQSRRLVKMATVGSLLGVLLLFSNVPLCPFAAMTGQPCPGCGLTRATRALLGGDFATSLRFHPLGALIAPIVTAWFLLGAWRYVREGRFRLVETEQSRWATWVAAIVGGLTVAVWIGRFFGAFGGPVSVST